MNSDDLIAGPRTITIREVDIRPGTEQPVSIYFEGDNGKPWKPCKSMSRVLVHAWGPDAKKYLGKSLMLYRDPDVTWAGMKVGGIRISHMSHIEREFVMSLTATKKTKAVVTIKVLQALKERAAEDHAAKWAAGYIAKVETFTSVEDLQAFEQPLAQRLDELKQKRPELHEQVLAASQARAASFAREGKPESEMGEGFNTDDDEVEF
ncbi:hypothetical protein [Sphingobium baderi]|uniref:hypothetical protein n=1 Tax=Sphingobium baderi TaxID=1332080 RepID=UPI0011DFD46C|nr:hypothetical protein [Sphingobium baderi]